MDTTGFEHAIAVGITSTSFPPTWYHSTFRRRNLHYIETYVSADWFEKLSKTSKM